MASTSSTDRIEKKITLRATRERVWRALSDSKQFGTWFGVDLDGPFEPGKLVTGRMTPTKVDAEVAKIQEPYAGHHFEWTVERVEPMRLISFRWHPFAIDPTHDYSKEPTTLIVFELAEVAGGVELRITESGFDKLPPERRAQAFKANEGGWEKQAELIAKYLAGAGST
jgi:uncharacterized protein YndB with AHSA1/START domain